MSNTKIQGIRGQGSNLGKTQTKVNNRAKYNDEKTEVETRLDYINENGVFFKSDCIRLLRGIKSEKINLCFADPPFNFGKSYEDESFKDQLNQEEYEEWCHTWLDELIRVLVPGGALCVYTFPKLAITLGYWLNKKREIAYRSLIALNMKSGFPIRGRLHPALYTILYYVKKGKKPKFNVVRIKTPTCRHCGKEIKNYGGYRPKYQKFEDENGIPWVQISDFWDDTRPARHDKSRKNTINELPIHIPERMILATTDQNDIVLDIFGGGGSTYHAAQLHDRLWIGCDVIEKPTLRRFATIWGKRELNQVNPKVKECFRENFIESYLNEKIQGQFHPIKSARLLPNRNKLAEKVNSKSKILLDTCE